MQGTGPEFANHARAGAADSVRVAAQEAFFAEQFAPLVRTAYVLLGDVDLAEEVVMDAFASLLRRWSAVEAADNPRAYVRRAVANLCASRIRRLAAERRARARLRARRDGALMGATPPQFSEEGTAVVASVRRLPPRQRLCVALRYFEDLSEAEVAEVLGCSPGTVKSQLAKARAALAGMLRVEEDR